MSFVGGLIFGTIWFSIFCSIIVLVYAFFCIGRMRMFQKAGEKGYKAWIPFYSDYVLCRLTMGRGWYFLFGFIPFLYPVMRVIYAIEVVPSYGQGPLLSVLYFFLPTISELILGFGDARYQGSRDLEAQVRSLFHTTDRGPTDDGTRQM